MSLDVRPQREHTAARALAVLAYTTAAYPLLLVGLLYGQWLLSWWVLGRQPRPSLDDPAYIAGTSWMHWVTGLVFIGYVPMFIAAAVLNTLCALRHRNPGAQSAIRMTGCVTLWLGSLLLFRADPGLVVAWWCD
jgi:hypothetical protein